ncbi:MAG: capsid protein [Avonheates virus SG_28]|uniref:capsid protein n=1 Tax=Avonheates virus SG_28 TaxID=2914484 RepID=UPI002481B702|nr:MAG: capsid protein [Avonheates virus SG_28]UNI72615.1 MAG: capsid protein [Avonheates virus SG_28]
MVRAKRSTSAKRRTPRKLASRKTTTKRKTPKKKTTSRKLKDTMAHRQLAMYYNPFAKVTNQPKIPDGKVGESLGFQTQSVREISNSPSGDSFNSRLHILLFPGLNVGAVVRGDAGAEAVYTADTNKINLVGFVGSNDLDFTAVDATGGLVSQTDFYGKWRTVSQGMKLTLLNPDEVNDGWWESIRVQWPQAIADYRISCRDLTTDKTQGAVSPIGVIYKLLASGSMANEPSYATGVLRDIHKHRFDLHPTKDDHDFNDCLQSQILTGDDVASFDAVDQVATFRAGRDNPAEMLRSWIDNSYDMIYVRIHGRQVAPPTKLHMNVVANQEILFTPGIREGRFHTPTENMDMDEHTHVRRGDTNSAYTIPP